MVSLSPPFRFANTLTLANYRVRRSGRVPTVRCAPIDTNKAGDWVCSEVEEVAVKIGDRRCHRYLRAPLG